MTTYKNDFIQIINQFDSIDNLEPNPQLNYLLENYVSMICNSSDHTRETYKILRPFFSKSQLFCMRAETALEHHWSDKVLKSSNASVTINDFPYIDKYEKLIEEEINIINTYKPSGKSIAFIGAGPLPLSSVLLSHQYNVTMIDWEQSALNSAKDLFDKLAIGNCNFVKEDASTIKNIDDYDVIILAASVGNEVSKVDIINHIYEQMNPEALLLIRTATGIKELLYPSVSFDDLPPCAAIIKQFDFAPEIINSVIAVKKA